MGEALSVSSIALDGPAAAGNLTIAELRADYRDVMNSLKAARSEA
jgi:cytidylate kinase